MDEGLPKVPKLELAQLKFVLTNELKSKSSVSNANNLLKDKLLAGIVLDSKTTFFSLTDIVFFLIYFNLYS